MVGNVIISEGVIYKLSVLKSKKNDSVELRYPSEKIFRKLANNMDVIKRVVSSAYDRSSMNTSLFDVTSISFYIRSRVDEIAQSLSSATRKVIVTFGCGNLQEWHQMDTANFSYIAIGSDVRITKMVKKVR